MRARIFAAWILLGSFLDARSVAQVPSTPGAASQPTAGTEPQQPAPSMNEIIERVIAREKEEMKLISEYSPIIETYIQEVRPEKILGIVPKADFYFLGQADFRGRLKVHSLLDGEKKGNWMWSYNPAGFLQMVFIDRAEFDKAHYHFEYVRREFLGEVRCYVFDVSPALKAHGPRFVGRIWVEDRDMTIVHFIGMYTPPIHFSLKTLQDEYYLHFDSWRTNVKSGL
jgi:hypothetical protein